jgi:hypothetical protein
VVADHRDKGKVKLSKGSAIGFVEMEDQVKTWSSIFSHVTHLLLTLLKS